MLSVPIFKFTFFNTDYPSGIVVPAPLGWRNASLSLERHETYHSLIERFKGTFIWYGLAREVLTAHPFDLNFQTRVLIEINFGSGFETIFDGMVDWVNGEDISKANSFYKYQAPIIRNDFWSKFLNRKDTPVDLQSTTDLDGGTRTAVNKIVLPLTGQIITVKSKYEGSNSIGQTESGVTGSSGFIQIGLEPTLKEIENTYTLPIGLLSSALAVTPILNLAFEGDLQIDVSGSIRITATATQNIDAISYDISTKRNTESNVGIDGGIENPGATTFDDTLPISGTHTFSSNKVGDDIRIFGGVAFSLASSGNIDWTFEFVDLVIEITQLSKFPDSETDAYLIKDAAESILSKITGTDDVIVSSLFDSGCERLRALMRGKHVRGYRFTDKQFFMSFKEWEEGALPQIGIGLGYIGDKIEIEKVEDFYDPNFTVTFDNVADLVRTYDNEKIYKKIEVGYQKGLSESESGIDDTQTKRTFRTKYSTIGGDFKAISQWLAASLAIEKSRRNRVELGKDDRNDEEIMSICLSEDGSDYLPELDENFDSITGLLNSNTRYNSRDSATRVLNRWKKWLFSCLSSGDKLFFASGEGNYEMASTLGSGDCEAGAVTENGDFTSSGEFIFKPIPYKFSASLSWEKYKSIVATRKKAIGVSRGTTDHKACFIIDFDYKMAHGKGEFLVLLGEEDLL